MQNAITLTYQSTELAEAINTERLSQLLSQFNQAMDLRVRAQEIASNTAQAYARGAERFIQWQALNGSGSGLADTIREWKAAMIESGSKPSAINTWLAGVRALFTYATESGLILSNPASTIKGATRKGTKKRHAREDLSGELSLINSFNYTYGHLYRGITGKDTEPQNIAITKIY